MHGHRDDVLARVQPAERMRHDHEADAGGDQLDGGGGVLGHRDGIRARGAPGPARHPLGRLQEQVMRQVGDRHGVGRGVRVLLGQDRDLDLAVERHDREAAAVDGEAEERDVGGSVDEGGRRVGLGERHDPQRHVGDALVPGAGPLGDGDAGHDRDDETARGRGGLLGQARGLGGDRGAGLREPVLARGAEARGAVVAHEQLDAPERLEVEDRPAHGDARDVEGLRGAGEVQLVGDGGEVPEGGRVGVHGSPLDGPHGGGARSGGGSDPA